MENHHHEELNEQLYNVLAKMKTKEEVKTLLEDLCTIREIEQMAQRIESAKLLLENKTYTQIIEMTDISSATLSRISKCIQYGSGGYNKLLANILKEETENGN